MAVDWRHQAGRHTCRHEDVGRTSAGYGVGRLRSGVACAGRRWEWWSMALPWQSPQAVPVLVLQLLSVNEASSLSDLGLRELARVRQGDGTALGWGQRRRPYGRRLWWPRQPSQARVPVASCRTVAQERRGSAFAWSGWNPPTRPSGAERYGAPNGRWRRRYSASPPDARAANGSRCDAVSQAIASQFAAKPNGLENPHDHPAERRDGIRPCQRD